MRFLLAIFIVLTGSPVVAYDYCTVTSGTYNLAIGDISASLKRYTACIGNSRGNDPCISEFNKLKIAQSAFESAVAGVQVSCLQ
jgi:hypothetical protein